MKCYKMLVLLCIQGEASFCLVTKIKCPWFAALEKEPLEQWFWIVPGTNPSLFSIQAALTPPFTIQTASDPPFITQTSLNPLFRTQTTLNPPFTTRATMNSQFTTQTTLNPSFTIQIAPDPPFTIQTAPNPPFTIQTAPNPPFPSQIAPNPLLYIKSSSRKDFDHYKFLYSGKILLVRLEMYPQGSHLSPHWDSACESQC